MSIGFEFDALDSGAGSSRRDQFLIKLLETPLPGVHSNAGDDEAQLSPATWSPQTLNAGSPRLVGGARESHIVPGYQQTARNWDSDHAAMKILVQGSEGDPSSRRARSGEQYFSKADGDLSHSLCFEFLCRKGPSLLIENLEDKEKVCSVLLNMADIVKVLPPANEPLPRDILDMTLWRASLWALVQEMKTVEENFPSLIGNCGVYVLTASPYSAFLRALAAEIADRRLDAVEK